jgi:hypothetical protein
MSRQEEEEEARGKDRRGEPKLKWVVVGRNSKSKGKKRKKMQHE